MVAMVIWTHRQTDGQTYIHFYVFIDYEKTIFIKLFKIVFICMIYFYVTTYGEKIPTGGGSNLIR